VAELTREVMFLIEDWDGYSDGQIAALNFELMGRLGSLEPGSAAYCARAAVFHLEASLRSPPDVIASVGRLGWVRPA
jgi:hypothetical protein